MIVFNFAWIYFANKITNMNNEGNISIRIVVQFNGKAISPDNYDIRLARSVIDNIILLLGDKDKSQPNVYSIEEGSLVNVIKTSKQRAVEIAAMLSMFSTTLNVDALETNTSKAMNGFRELAMRNNIEFSLSTSETTDAPFYIKPDTQFIHNENVWVEAELYFFGKLIDAGGKEKSNIHILTEFGTLTISADKDYLAGLEMNPLYKEYGVVVKGKQNILTGEIDYKTLTLIELKGFSLQFDEHYLNEKIVLASQTWDGVDVDEYILEVSGGDVL